MGLLVRNKLSQAEIRIISRLLRDNPSLFVSANAVSPREYAKYFINSTNHILQDNKKSRLLIIKNRQISGAALLRFMDWDSSFFKIPIGCIEYIVTDRSGKDTEIINGIERALLENSIGLASNLGIKILYITINSERHSAINTLNYLRFNFICSEIKGIIRGKDMSYISMADRLSDEYKFRNYRKEDYPQIIKVAREINKDLNSKFKLTPFLPSEEKNNYYLENIKNCCLGLNADEIFVVTRKRDIVGFIGYRYDKIFDEAVGNKLSFLVIGGVLQAERKKNIGTSLFTFSHKRIFINSELILWKTYLHNLPIIRFILKRGFVPSFEIIHTFCKKL